MIVDSVDVEDRLLELIRRDCLARSCDACLFRRQVFPFLVKHKDFVFVLCKPKYEKAETTTLCLTNADEESIDAIAPTTRMANRKFDRNMRKLEKDLLLNYNPT